MSRSFAKQGNMSTSMQNQNNICKQSSLLEFFNAILVGCTSPKYRVFIKS